MFQKLLITLIPLGILLALDTYAFQAFKTITDKKIVHTIYWGIALAAYISLFAVIFTNIREWQHPLRIYFSASLMLVYFFKLVVSGFLVIDDSIRIGKWIATWFSNPSSQGGGFSTISRSEFISKMGIIVATIPFLALVNGMVRNAYNYRVKNVKLTFKNLPEVFRGMKIVQISDIHTGSFTAKKPIEKAIELIKAQNADMVFFTGDLVNYKAEEAIPYIDLFSQIKAKLGVFSIMGNHDYGDYVRWDSKEERAANHEKLKDVHKKMGWQLLLNEHHIIEKEGHKMAIIGVENWSAKEHFGRYGDMAKAYANCEDCDVKLLLSHDPSHWQAEIVKDYKDIDAAFAGHTHGFQFGINIPGFQWSPVKYAYKEWMGLYQEGDQQLYVNPGFGYLGYPGRVGFLPEITVFELV